MEYGAVLLWWMLYAALALAGLPIAAVLFRRLEGRGAAFALPVALVVLFVSVYWIGRFTFGTGAVTLAVVILLAASALCYTRVDPEIDFRRYREWLAVFTVAFLFLVAIRGVDPAVRPIGGEKFLDFGLLKTILRDTALPPEDMWFAGKPVQYYYGGHLLSAILTTITGTAPKYAYNLALAGFYAALVSTAFGLAGSIAASRGSSYRTGGLFGAFLVGIASNLVTPLQVLLMPVPGAVADFAAKRFATLPEGGGGYGLAPESLLNGFDGYWTPSRVIPGTINEFPLFAWLNGDLHAHMMSTPFLLLLAGVVFAYYLTPEEEIRRRRLLLFGVAPPIAGTIAVVNTWSFPSTAGLAFLGVLFARANPLSLLDGDVRSAADGELGRLISALIVGVGVLVVSAFWVLPFLIGPAIGGGERGLGFVSDGSGWSGLFLVHGWALTVFAVYFVARASDGIRSIETGGWMVAAVVAVLSVITILAGAPAFGLVAPLLLIGWIKLRRSDAVGFESVLFVAGAGLVLIVELIFLKERGGGRLNTVFKTYMQVWILWGTAAGAALAIMTPDRPVLAMLDGAAAALNLGETDVDQDQLRGQVAAVAGVALVVTLSMYGVLALGTHFGDNHFSDAPDQPEIPSLATAGEGEFIGDTGTYLGYVFTDPSLDATAYLDAPGSRRAGEAPAIAWLDDREGKPTIVTAAPGGYRWSPRTGDGASAPASLTGVPTVLGWFHEEQYRGTDPYQQRLDDVKTIYQSDAANRSRLLAEYDVEYVYAGPAERNRYGRANVSALDEVEGVSVARGWGGGVTVYQVDQSELTAG